MKKPTARPTVLCVDDSPGHLKLLEMTLGARDLVVRTAANGHEALTVLQSITPDAIIVDVEMPFMDGFELTRRIRRLRRLATVPILVMTAQQAPDLEERVRECGADAVVRKPVQGQNVTRLLMRMLRDRAVVPDAASE